MLAFDGPRRLLASLALTLCLLPSATFAQDEAKLTDAERQELLDLLSESAEFYLGALAAVSDAQWNWKPNPDRWSVGECAEHIVLTNEGLFFAVQGALSQPADPDWKEKSEKTGQFMREVMPNRDPVPAGVPASERGGAIAPVEVRPTGEPSRAEVIARFQALYVKAREFVKTIDRPLKAHLMPHPFPVFNPLNASDWAAYIPLHTIRHTKQMIEVMETDGYPSS